MNRRDVLEILSGMGAGFVVAGGSAHAGDHGGKKAGSPVSGPHAHFCGIHVAKSDPKFQLVVQHYCVAHSGNHGESMFQCILFDSTDKNAKLIGVEYIVPDDIYRKLPDAEKKYWHPHTYEVLAGGLIAPGMESEDEKKFMKMVMTTWGKTWHTWPDPKSPVPMGEPMLIWALTGDGQADEKVVAARDKEFGVDTAGVRKRRIEEIGYEVPQVAAPKSMDTIGRQWTNDGADKPSRRP